MDGRTDRIPGSGTGAMHDRSGSAGSWFGAEDRWQHVVSGPGVPGGTAMPARLDAAMEDADLWRSRHHGGGHVAWRAAGVQPGREEIRLRSAMRCQVRQIEYGGRHGLPCIFG